MTYWKEYEVRKEKEIRRKKGYGKSRKIEMYIEQRASNYMFYEAGPFTFSHSFGVLKSEAI
jgi:hypothetical protein